MSELFLATLFEDNLALSYFLGICTFLAVSRRVDTALGLGLVMIVVMGLTVPLNQLLYAHLLRAGALDGLGIGSLDLSFLTLVFSIATIAGLVQILEMALFRFSPRLYDALGIFLPLITVNCAILGASLFSIDRNHDLSTSLVYGLGSGLGWAIAIVLFAAIRERLRYSFVPDSLQGLGIAFLVTGLMSLGFSVAGGLG